jgi:hypothetical protein
MTPQGAGKQDEKKNTHRERARKKREQKTFSEA